MSVTIYVEGGGNRNNDAEKIRCKQGFREYCNRICAQDRHPKIVACGGRNEAFRRFKIAVEAAKPGETVVLLVDSEEPVGKGISPKAHLTSRDRWNFPEITNHKLFLMVQAMETWFFADRQTLARFYGQGFLSKSLPGDEQNAELIPKDTLEPALRHASKATQKGSYHKTKHGFDILAMVDPERVQAGSAHARDFNDFLRDL